MSDKISTTALAKLRSIEPKQLFAELKTAGYINRAEESWVLTELGAKFGGEYVEHAKLASLSSGQKICSLTPAPPAEKH